MFFPAGIPVRMVLFSFLAVFDFFCLLGSYSVLRSARLPVDRITWLLGSTIIAAALLYTCSLLLSIHIGLLSRFGNLFGLLAFLVAIFATGQWVMRQWFLQIKKRITQSGSSIMQWSKNVLVFMRKQHVLFGLVVASGAAAHAIFYLPALLDIKFYELVTGFIALGILALMVVLGVWMWLLTRMKKRLPKLVHSTHALLTIAFLVVLVMHI